MKKANIWAGVEDLSGTMVLNISRCAKNTALAQRWSKSEAVQKIVIIMIVAKSWSVQRTLAVVVNIAQDVENIGMMLVKIWGGALGEAVNTGIVKIIGESDRGDDLRQYQH